MRSRKNHTISSSSVQDQAAALLQQYLEFKDQGYRCQAWVVISVLLFAASRVTSIFDACNRLRQAPSDDALRKALAKMLPEMGPLERRINAALSDRLPKPLLRRSLRVAIDITDIPYHGKPFREGREICRAKPRSGTTHFHSYATAYVVEHGQRFTLALTYVWGNDSKHDVTKRLVRQVRSLGLKIRYLLLDRGFYTVEVIRYLQAARCPFLMPVMYCGGKAKDPRRSDSANRFQSWKRSGWATHILRNKKRSATVRVAVACDQWNGRRGKQGLRVLVFAFWGFQPQSPAWTREEYRKRFGIETSYRQMNQARIRTCTRQPKLRLLIIGIALLLRNLWVWIHLMHLSYTTPQGRIRLCLQALRFRLLLHWLEESALTLLGGIVTQSHLTTIGTRLRSNA